jgi:hypothetical protein
MSNDEFCKEIVCKNYSNRFQCPMGKDSFDDNGNIINICKYEIEEE